MPLSKHLVAKPSSEHLVARNERRQVVRLSRSNDSRHLRRPHVLQACRSTPRRCYQRTFRLRPSATCSARPLQSETPIEEPNFYDGR